MLSVGITLIAAATSANPTAPLTLLSDEKARCMDGTQAGFYMEGNASSSGWVIFLEGGGECTTESMCKSRLNGPLGSSKYWEKTMHFKGLISALPANPLNEWNRVYVPYCSQDLHSGQRATPSAESWGLIFSGHHILEAIVDRLMDAGLKNASTVVFTGNSAGGMGVWPNIDWLQTKVPSARVVGAPLAGFYFYAYPYTGKGSSNASSPLADFRPPAWPQHVKLWDSFLPQSCVEAGGGPGCMLANISGKTVKAPLFVIEAETDSVQITNHDWVPRNMVYGKNPEVMAYLTEWRDNQTLGIAANLKPGDGYFRPACFVHTTFGPLKPTIEGETYFTAFYKWLKGTPVRLMDNCGLLCNPTCGRG